MDVECTIQPKVLHSSVPSSTEGQPTTSACKNTYCGLIPQLFGCTHASTYFSFLQQHANTAGTLLRLEPWPTSALCTCCGTKSIATIPNTAYNHLAQDLKTYQLMPQACGPLSSFQKFVQKLCALPATHASILLGAQEHQGSPSISAEGRLPIAVAKMELAP